jgi:O-antigen ligase
MGVTVRRGIPGSVRALRDPLLRVRYPVTGGLLFGALITMAAWNHPPVGRLAVVTIGRLWLAATGVALIVEAGGPRALIRGLRRARPTPGLVLLAGGLVGLGLIVISAHSNGCQCSGGLYGVAELDLWTGLALLAVVLEPALALVLLAGALGGAVLAGLLAVAGVHTAGEVNAGTDRLTGTYGNPNFLAATQALLAPVALVGALAPERALGASSDERRRMLRLACAAALLVLAGVDFFTFSRSGLLAAAGGGFVGLLMILRGRRARLWAVGAAVVAIGAGAALYSAYNNLRTTADFGSDASRGLINPNGWETIQTGLIGRGPGTISTPAPGVLRIAATGPWEGASVPLPRARVGVTYELRFQARTISGGPRMSVGMEDNLTAAGPVQQTVTLSRTWTPQVLDWVPTGPAPHARAYFWAPAAGAFELRDLVAVPQPGPSAGARRTPVITLPTTVGGSDQAAKRQALAAQEARFVRSRQSVLRLAITAFVHNPVRGMGWERFPTYAAARLHEPPIATHDEYTRYAAELGIGGALALLAMVIACAWAAIRVRRAALAPAVAGLLAAAAIELGFTNLLETPNAALGIAVGAAIAVGLASRGAPDEPALGEPDAERP